MAFKGRVWYYSYEVKKNLKDSVRSNWRFLDKKNSNPISSEVFIGGVLHFEYEPLRGVKRFNKKLIA
ncbi:hypothetical protein M1M30_gp146 [Maribacter phage Colly_1]|uniref:Uncharacterized protein n=1 Tax=Maribacter phage Colly_1 TaxID=2745691 RepID=A0A8E4XV87_9CAUD|nr:hypothetical protein M1M30_gp146 [Maribacter phage Colly_1]QQO97247.1 hypothetical protein Colly1_146 [Maribacter phage Colly_1]